MDSFIDKLAQKFTAQEIIKANSSAEAAELKRTREQVQQYENCLEEMKNVNESMKESLAKLEQSLDIDFEKFGQVQVSTEGIQTAIEDGMDDINDAIAKNMTEIKELQNEAKLQQDLAQEQMNGQLTDIQDKLSGQLAGQIQSIQDCVSGQMQEQLQGMQNNFSSQMQDMQTNMSGLMYDQLQNVQNSIIAQVQNMQGEQGDVTGQLQSIQDVQGQLSDKMLSQMQDMQTIQDAQEKLSIQITGQLHAVQDKLLSQMKAERTLIMSAQEEGGKFSEEQLAALKEQTEALQESLKSQMESPLAAQKEQIVDYVHKENVKVYRNVQAVVVDEANKQNESISNMLNKVTAKNQLMMRLVIASVACSGVSLAATIFLILRSLGIF